MKNNYSQYTASGDLNTINCNLQNAELLVFPTQESYISVKCEKSKRLHICLNEGVLSIYSKRISPLFGLRKKRVRIFIPEHVTPEINVSGRNCSVEIYGGIYGRLDLDCDGGKVKLNDCSFAGASLSGDSLSTFLKGVTVKNALVAKCGAGDMVWENSFASCTECRVKNGNIGLSNFTCKDSILEAENGNVAARLNGSESDYNLGLLIKEGTANRQSVTREGAARTFKAYSAKGNIAIDFMPEDGAYEYGEI